MLHARYNNIINPYDILVSLSFLKAPQMVESKFQYHVHLSVIGLRRVPSPAASVSAFIVVLVSCFNKDTGPFKTGNYLVPYVIDIRNDKGA